MLWLITIIVLITMYAVINCDSFNYNYMVVINNCDYNYNYACCKWLLLKIKTIHVVITSYIQNYSYVCCN